MNDAFVGSPLADASAFATDEPVSDVSFMTRLRPAGTEACRYIASRSANFLPPFARSLAARKVEALFARMKFLFAGSLRCISWLLGAALLSSSVLAQSSEPDSPMPYDPDSAALLLARNYFAGGEGARTAVLEALQRMGWGVRNHQGAMLNAPPAGSKTPTRRNSRRMSLKPFARVPTATNRNSASGHDSLSLSDASALPITISWPMLRRP